MLKRTFLHAATLLVFTLLLLSHVLLTSSQVEAKCAGVDTVVIKCDSTKPGNGVWDLLQLTLDILAVGLGIAAVGGIAYAALLWTSAGDNAAQVQKAKEAVRNTVIGLILFVGLYGFTSFLIPGGAPDKQSLPIAATDPDDRTPSKEDDSKEPNSNKNKKASVRIGIYNAQSVNKSTASQLSRFKQGWTKIKDATDIVVAAEFSTAHYRYLSNFSNWNAYYPSNARGDRGKAILYRKDIFTATDHGSVSLPLITTSNRSVRTYEPTITLTRKRDGAKLSIMAVHLAAINGNTVRWQTNQRNQQPVVGRWLKSGGNRTRVAAGDFNWYMPGHAANLTGIPMKIKGERVMRAMIPKSQQFGGFYKSIPAGGISDHSLIVVEVETKWFK